ncbi:MAG: B-box zinc finger protein [Planctomycetota bacterium]|jgi:hypothetical protein|nr:B-box zinc finger protein [Planctomycetota bacterium]MDP7253153.1 B-box zinc finger protein [Planctomycetota bacterium]
MEWQTYVLGIEITFAYVIPGLFQTIRCSTDVGGTVMARQAMCFTHHERPAKTRCRTCQKPVCSECIFSNSAGQFCSSECAEKTKNFQPCDDTQIIGGKMGGGVKALVKGVVGIVGLAAVAVFVGAKFLNIGIFKKILKMAGL